MYHSWTRSGLVGPSIPGARVVDQRHVQLHTAARRIRPIVIGVALRDDRILAVECYDPIKGERFYRPPGGGLEFGETSAEALRREFREELDAEITDIGYLGALENVFTFDGEPGHEIVVVHRVTLVDGARFGADTVTVSESDGSDFTARWLPLAEVRSGAERLYPDGLLSLLSTTADPAAPDEPHR